MTLTRKIGLGIAAGIVLVTLIAFFWTPYDPLQAAPQHRLEGPSLEHWMGTDQFGRDMLSRVMAGARLTLVVSLGAVALSALVGVPLGVWAGMRRGAVESVVMRASDLLLAFPALLLAIVFTAVFGASVWILSLIHI